MKSPIDDAYVAEQYNLGRTTSDIAQELNVNAMTISRHLKSIGVEVRRRGRRKKPQSEKAPKKPKAKKKAQQTARKPTRQKYCPYLFLAMANMGMTTYEIERLTGANHSSVSTHLRKLGYCRGKGKGPNRAKLDAEKKAEGKRRFIERFISRYGDRFEYLGGYEGCRSNSKPTLRCKTCGHEFERYIDWDFEIRCPECYRRQVEANSTKRHTVCFIRCVECNEVFIAEVPTAKFCSERCRRRAKNRKADARRRASGWRRNRDTTHRSRARKYGVAYDSAITLEWMIEQDRNICHICGGKCDRSDRSYGHLGPKYPSIDCVIPMAKGGGFTKDNVRLAHFLCNANKRDLLEW